jgi:hypothetical protein
MFTRTDANSRNADCICDLLRDVGEHNLQDHRKCPGFFHRARINKQSFGL